MSVSTVVSPRLCNTGANSLSDLLTWDWYQATITALPGPYEPMRVLSAVVGSGAQWKACPSYNGWSQAKELVGLEVGTLVVLFGGRDDIHIQATSSAADLVVPLIRANWPIHTVSRADVAYDVDEPGSFERLHKAVHSIARNGEGRRGPKVSTSLMGDWLDLVNGRTFYAGTKSSRVQVRVYEKGHEQLGKDPDCGASKDWTRVEWELRPASKQKGWLAGASKEQALGLSAFGAAVADGILDLEVDAVGGSFRFASQDPLAWMGKQYRKSLLPLYERGDAAVMAELARILGIKP